MLWCTRGILHLRSGPRCAVKSPHEKPQRNKKSFHPVCRPPSGVLPRQFELLKIVAQVPLSNDQFMWRPRMDQSHSDHDYVDETSLK